jgi:hypothetical protein
MDLLQHSIEWYQEYKSYIWGRSCREWGLHRERLGRANLWKTRKASKQMLSPETLNISRVIRSPVVTCPDRHFHPSNDIASTVLSNSTSSRTVSIRITCLSRGHAYLSRHQAPRLDSGKRLRRKGARAPRRARSTPSVLSPAPQPDRARSRHLPRAKTRV